MIKRCMGKIAAGIVSLFLVNVVFSFIFIPWYLAYYLFLPLPLDRIKVFLLSVTLSYPLSIIALSIINGTLVTIPYVMYERIKRVEVLYRDSSIPVSVLIVSMILFWGHRVLEFYLTGTLFLYYVPFFSESPLRIPLFLVISSFGWIFWLTLTQFFLPKEQ